ncbi:MAG: transglycosylase SLT domain-containing protein [Lautropia sp.]
MAFGTLTLLFLAQPALAQIGGPIGAPSGIPNGLPAGASGYNRNSGTSMPPPVNNWSANESGRGGIGNGFIDRFGSRAWTPPANSKDEIPLPPSPQIQQTAPAAVGPQRDRRERDDKDFAGSDDGGRGKDPVPATRQIAAAQHNPVEALRDLVQKGQMYETGLGVRKNLARAFDLYCEAARDGYPDALIRMGWMFAEGNGVEKNHSAASTLFKRAARFGSSVGDELAQRFTGDRELLPVCLKGTLVEKGTAERPATTAELSAMAPKFDMPLVMRNSLISAERAQFVGTVIAEARNFKLDPRLVLAVMATESGFDPNARSPKNAAGLMQLIPETAERFNVKDVLDPVENIRGGMAYLRWLLSYFRGDVTLTLAAYNAGEGAVDKHSGVPPFTETLAYVQKIRALYPFDRHPYDATVSSGISRTAPQPTRTVDAKSAVGGDGSIARN